MAAPVTPLPQPTRQQLAQAFSEPATLQMVEQLLRQTGSSIPAALTSLENLQFVLTTTDTTVAPNGHLITAGANIGIAVATGLVTIKAVPSGTDGQIQYNNAGTFGGFTVSGDATLNTATGVLTIANEAVTLAKIQNATANSILLGSGAAGSGSSYAQITLGAGLTMTGTTLSASGSVSGANPTATAGPAAVNGSASTFMRSDAAPPVQLGSASQAGIVQVDGTSILASGGVISATAGGGSSLALLSSQTVSAVAEVDFTSVISSTYDQYILQTFNVRPSVNGAIVGIQFSSNNGSTWITSGYSYALQNWSATSNFQAYGPTTSASFILIFFGISNAFVTPGSSTTQLTGLLNASFGKAVMTDIAAAQSDGNFYMSKSSGTYSTAVAINAFRVIPTSGNISGTFRLYGIAH